jgi:hypothetical protein
MIFRPLERVMRGVLARGSEMVMGMSESRLNATVIRASSSAVSRPGCGVEHGAFLMWTSAVSEI